MQVQIVAVPSQTVSGLEINDKHIKTGEMPVFMSVSIELKRILKKANESSIIGTHQIRHGFYRIIRSV